ncbi:MAG: hypothetical protein PHV68_04440 [Candidatus Gastranaerophilales bacterium]|nr:hypothetical protein [Candidatus Gastranaerophilales bacterium]
MSEYYLESMPILHYAATKGSEKKSYASLADEGTLAEALNQHTAISPTIKESRLLGDYVYYNRLLTSPDETGVEEPYAKLADKVNSTLEKVGTDNIFAKANTKDDWTYNLINKDHAQYNGGIKYSDGENLVDGAKELSEAHINFLDKNPIGFWNDKDGELSVSELKSKEIDNQKIPTMQEYYKKENLDVVSTKESVKMFDVLGGKNIKGDGKIDITEMTAVTLMADGAYIDENGELNLSKCDGTISNEEALAFNERIEKSVKENNGEDFKSQLFSIAKNLES